MACPVHGRERICVEILRSFLRNRFVNIWQLECRSTALKCFSTALKCRSTDLECRSTAPLRQADWMICTLSGAHQRGDDGNASFGASGPTKYGALEGSDGPIPYDAMLLLVICRETQFFARIMTGSMAPVLVGSDTHPVVRCPCLLVCDGSVFLLAVRPVCGWCDVPFCPEGCWGNFCLLLLRMRFSASQIL